MKTAANVQLCRCMVCDGPAVLVQRRDSLQRLTFVPQCQTCGRAGPAQPHQWVRERYAEDDIPEFDANIAQRYENDQQAARAAGRNQYRDEYLQSARWKAKRERVLKRDLWTCQSCLEAPAHEVHHRTYLRIGAEPAFDLVSLCEPCHRRLHAEDKARRGAR